MSCLYCQEEGVALDDNGSCVICGIAVCGPPSQRIDGTFHGATCLCSCGKFICDADMRRHVRDDHPGSSVPSCFRGFADVIGPAAAVAASLLKKAFKEGTFDPTLHASEVSTLSRFVNAFLVSDDEIERPAGLLASTSLLSVQQVPDGPGRVVLNPGHMSEAVAERLLTASVNYPRLRSDKKISRDQLDQLDLDGWVGSKMLTRPTKRVLSDLANEHLIRSIVDVERWREKAARTDEALAMDVQMIQRLGTLGERVQDAALGSSEIRKMHARAIENVRLGSVRALGLHDDV